MPVIEKRGWRLFQLKKVEGFKKGGEDVFRPGGFEQWLIVSDAITLCDWLLGTSYFILIGPSCLTS